MTNHGDNESDMEVSYGEFIYQKIRERGSRAKQIHPFIEGI